MKIILTTELTPVEARELMGLPDVQPMQKAAMEALEERVRDRVQKFTGEGLIESWLGQSPQVTGLFSGIFNGLAKGAPGKPAGTSES